MKTIAIGVGKNKNITKALEIFKNRYSIDTKLIQTDEELVKSILDEVWYRVALP